MGNIELPCNTLRCWDSTPHCTTSNGIPYPSPSPSSFQSPPGWPPPGGTGSPPETRALLCSAPLHSTDRYLFENREYGKMPSYRMKCNRMWWNPQLTSTVPLVPKWYLTSPVSSSSVSENSLHIVCKDLPIKLCSTFSLPLIINTDFCDFTNLWSYGNVGDRSKFKRK